MSAHSVCTTLINLALRRKGGTWQSGNKCCRKVQARCGRVNKWLLCAAVQEEMMPGQGDKAPLSQAKGADSMAPVMAKKSGGR